MYKPVTPVYILNCSFVGNSAGVRGVALGGAVAVQTASVFIGNSTFRKNIAAAGGALAVIAGSQAYMWVPKHLSNMPQAPLHLVSVPHSGLMPASCVRSDVPQFMRVDEEYWGVEIPAWETSLQTVWEPQWQQYQVRKQREGHSFHTNDFMGLT